MSFGITNDACIKVFNCPSLSLSTTSGKIFHVTLAVIGIAGGVFSYLNGRPALFIASVTFVPFPIVLINLILKRGQPEKKQTGDLFEAIRSASEDEVQKCLANSFDAKAAFEEENALFYAFRKPNVAIIKALINSEKFDLTGQNKDGLKVLDCALNCYSLNCLLGDEQFAFKEIIYLLLKKNSDLKAILALPLNFMYLMKFLFSNRQDQKNHFFKELFQAIEQNKYPELWTSTSYIVANSLIWSHDRVFVDSILSLVDKRDNFAKVVFNICIGEFGQKDNEGIYTLLFSHLDLENVPVIEIVDNFFGRIPQIDGKFLEDENLIKALLLSFKKPEKLKEVSNLLAKRAKEKPQQYSVAMSRKVKIDALR